MLGELWSMSLGKPGCRGLFSSLQHELKFVEQDRIKITSKMQDLINNMEYLADHLDERPTSLAELVPDHPVASPWTLQCIGMGNGRSLVAIGDKLQPRTNPLVHGISQEHSRQAGVFRKPTRVDNQL